MLNHIKALSGVWGKGAHGLRRKTKEQKHKTMLTHKLRSGVGVCVCE